MDRRRTNSPSYTRQWSGGSSSTGSSSPLMSPAHPQSRLASTTGASSTIKRTQTAAAKAAASRLAKAMASSHTTDVYDDDEDEEEDDLGFRYSAPPPQLPSAYSGANGFRSNGVRVNRSPSPALGRNAVDNNATGRSTSAGRLSVSTRPTPMMPPAPRGWVLRTPAAAITQTDSPSGRFGNRGFSSTINEKPQGFENLKEASALRDELDMLQEENEVITDKLRQAEEKREQAEARARELEKQVASLGEGVSLEAKLLSRKEAALRQREAALKAAQQNKDGRVEEIATLRSEIEHLKEETTSALEKVHEVESEAKALRNMTQRMILTQEEMEEVVLKRCWLARFWGLAVEHGIFADIAESKHEYWSSLAPLPFELVISAGQKAKEESDYNDSVRGKQDRNLGDLTGEGNIESMLSVEMALRELASLKVEDAVAVAISLSRRSSIFRHHSSETKSPSDRKFVEASEISQKEADDVRFKEAWLTYFWRRAKTHGVEEDIAEERLSFWISRSGQTPTSHDAVDVERGLVELRKLGIEQQLWEASRKEIDAQESAEYDT